MPRTCTICKHAKREEIDLAMVAGLAYRYISNRFGTSKAALQRHKEHLPAALAKAKDALEITRGDTILQEVVSLKDKALSILRKAEKADQLNTALRAIAEARATLELLAKMTDKLREAPVVNILLLPEWRTLQARIADTLAPFPEARLAVAESLIAMEAGHARD